jgi:transcriptional regulator with XRE-family HTH domain
MTSATTTESGISRPEDMAVLARFGENLLRIRQARRLSQEALAERAGIHRTQISLLESGQRQPLLGTLLRLAGALEVPVTMLIEGITFCLTPVHGPQLHAHRPPDLPRVGAGGKSR